jgi:UDP-N-acetylglucosamine:LPS N-acetylglucosamine transferase
VDDRPEVLVYFLDWWRKLTGHSMEDSYNWMVRRGYTVGLVPLLRLMQWTVRLSHEGLVRRMSADLRKRRPSIVVSVIPNFNAPLRDAVHRALPGVPFVVLMTDPFDFPPHFWLEPDIDRVITAQAAVVPQAEALGIARTRVSVTSGMVLHPRFYPKADGAARARVRREMGIAGDRFVFLLLHGGKGSPEMLGIAESLLARCPEAAVIPICGDNPRLLARMTRLASRHSGRLHPTGFTSRVAELMAAADLLITKPGPGSLAEAFHQGIPVIVVENVFTVPQERANARWIREKGLGVVVGHTREIAPLAAELLREPARLAAMRERLQAMPENRAVDEALEVISAELERARERRAVPA